MSPIVYAEVDHCCCKTAHRRGVFHSDTVMSKRCSGGAANDDLLKKLVFCTVVNGSLEFVNMSGPALSLQDNQNLAVVELPSLESIYSDGSPWVIVRNNPLLSLGKQLSAVLWSVPDQHKDVSISDSVAPLRRGHRQTSLPEEDETEWSDFAVTDSPSKSESSSGPDYFLLIAVIVFLILVSCILACRARSVRAFVSSLTSVLPSPRYILRPKAQLVLQSFCEEILLMNPLLWKLEEVEFLGQEKKQCDKLDQLLKQHGDKTKEHMLPLAINGSLSHGTQISSCSIRNRDQIYERVQKMLTAKNVVVIGTTNDPTCVTPHIPLEPGQEYTYEGGDTSKIVLKLKRIKHVSATSRAFVYEAQHSSANNIKRSTLKFVYFVWAPLDLGVNAEEMLRLVQYCEDSKNSLCVSNRHKEVFSLLHLFYSFIVRLETPMPLSDVFRLHNEKCNGSLLDRNEMLFVLKFLLAWVVHSRAVPKKLLNNATNWLSTYDRMDQFRKSHPNVMSVHPYHLAGLPEEVVLDTVRNGGCDQNRFSYRIETIMRDKFISRNQVSVAETDLEKNVKKGQLRRMDMVQQHRPAMTPLSKPSAEEASPSTPSTPLEAYNKKGMDEYWASKEKEIQELLEKRMKKKRKEPSRESFEGPEGVGPPVPTTPTVEASKIPKAATTEEKAGRLTKQGAHPNPVTNALDEFIKRDLAQARGGAPDVNPKMRSSEISRQLMAQGAPPMTNPSRKKPDKPVEAVVAAYRKQPPGSPWKPLPNLSPARKELVKVEVPFKPQEPASNRKHKRDKSKTPTKSKRGRTPANAKSRRTPTKSKRGRTPANAKSRRTPSKSKRGRTPANAKSRRTPSKSKRGRTPANAKSRRTPAKSKRERTPANVKSRRTPAKSKRGRRHSAKQMKSPKH